MENFRSGKIVSKFLQRVLNLTFYLHGQMFEGKLYFLLLTSYDLNFITDKPTENDHS